MDDSLDDNQPLFLNSYPPAEVPENPNPRPAQPMRSLTRLVVGGVEVGIDELFRLLKLWEEEVEKSHFARAEGKVQEGSLPYGEAGSDAAQLDSPWEAESIKDLRFAVIGLIFETQERIEKEARTLVQVGKIVNRWALPWTGPFRAIYHSHFTAPVRTRLEKWAARGEAETARWIELGRAEDSHSRKLAQVAFDKTVDEYIEYLTSNPEVQELVQTQSTGLANEVIEEVRERTVSADNLLEGIARSLLHRVPRAALPEPSPALRKIAAPRPLRKGGEKK